MRNPTAAERDAETSKLRRVESALGNLLRGGVFVSVLFLAGGMALSAARHTDSIRDPKALEHLTHPDGSSPHSLREVGGELAQGRGRAITMLGLILLILTPIARVAASVAAFALERDWRFVGITAFVLIVLGVSFWVGRVG